MLHEKSYAYQCPRYIFLQRMEPISLGMSLVLTPIACYCALPKQLSFGNSQHKTAHLPLIQDQSWALRYCTVPGDKYKEIKSQMFDQRQRTRCQEITKQIANKIFDPAKTTTTITDRSVDRHFSLFNLIHICSWFKVKLMPNFYSLKLTESPFSLHFCCC